MAYYWTWQFSFPNCSREGQGWRDPIVRFLFYWPHISGLDPTNHRSALDLIHDHPSAPAGPAPRSFSLFWDASQQLGFGPAAGSHLSRKLTRLPRHWTRDMFGVPFSICRGEIYIYMCIKYTCTDPEQITKNNFVAQKRRQIPSHRSFHSPIVTLFFVHVAELLLKKTD